MPKTKISDFRLILLDRIITFIFVDQHNNKACIGIVIIKCVYMHIKSKWGKYSFIMSSFRYLDYSRDNIINIQLSLTEENAQENYITS